MSVARTLREALLATAGRWPKAMFGELSPRAQQLARAEAMDFDTSRIFYRASRSDERVARANKGSHGPGVYINSATGRANDHAGVHDPAAIGGNIMPLFVRRGKFRPTVGVEGIVPEPQDVRSIFAEFDPAKADSANLLAGAAIALPVGGITLREILRGRMMGEA